MTTEVERNVVDSHSLVWHLTGDPRLSDKASAAIRLGETGGSELILPSIVLAELLRIVEKGRTGLSLARVVEWIGRSATIVVVPFDLEVFATMVDFATELELHDRIIAATARLAGARVITKDAAFEGVVETLW